MQKPGLPAIIAIALILLSGILFGLVFVVPFLSLSLTFKGVLLTSLVIGMEITWWTGVVLVGKQLLTKYLRHLNPRTWFITKNKKGQEDENN